MGGTRASTGGEAHSVDEEEELTLELRRGNDRHPNHRDEKVVMPSEGSVQEEDTDGVFQNGTRSVCVFQALAMVSV